MLQLLKFNWNDSIHICIALSEFTSSNFNKILQEIIKKSLFTERQIEIILHFKNLREGEFPISKGAYFRQVKQCRNKLIGFYYSIILLGGIGVMLPNDIDVMSRLSEHVAVIQNSDVFPEKEKQIIDVIDDAIRQTTGM